MLQQVLEVTALNINTVLLSMSERLRDTSGDRRYCLILYTSCDLVPNNRKSSAVNSNLWFVKDLYHGCSERNIGLAVGKASNEKKLLYTKKYVRT
jgi:hypothetical protein